QQRGSDRSRPVPRSYDCQCSRRRRRHGSAFGGPLLGRRHYDPSQSPAAIAPRPWRPGPRAGLPRPDPALCPCAWIRSRDRPVAGRRSARLAPPSIPAARSIRMRILVTGAAGFIGSHLSHRLVERGDEVLGFDNLNGCYAPALKQARLDRLLPRPGFSFVKGSLEDRGTVERAFANFRPQRVVNLAAQAGVRYSLENPHAYI